MTMIVTGRTGAPRRMEYSGGSKKRSGPAIRRARPNEFAQRPKMGFEADKFFEAVGMGPFVNYEAEDYFGSPALVLVVGDPLEGFV